MGLDTVELIIAIENYFQIAIPDAEAEKIYTLRDMARVVARHLQITTEHTGLQEQLLQQVAGGIRSSVLTDREIALTDLVSTYLSPGATASWSIFTQQLLLQVPVPEIAPAGNRFSDRLKRAFRSSPTYDWATITIEQFIAVMAACNSRVLIDPKNISSTYEIYVIVASITVEQTGVDPYETGPDKSFTDDLGIE
ncbi:hypothetical protein [Chitinophaga nivalis]|uniref:hypothetical protein n=1 Tax=Chitinophaga nivalis TaxID=2991709 RepID=UPI0027D9C2B3|nr:hypothetical protein [Chitinophaga nivalis]